MPLENQTVETGSVVIEGVCPVVETPFTSEGEVDYESFERLVDHLLGVGVRSVMYPGYASEFYKLTDHERDKLIELLIKSVHKVPGAIAVISVPDQATHIATRRARRAVTLGADMINILPPHMTHGPSGASVALHVDTLLNAIAPTPALLQYAPAQTGTGLDAATISRMALDADNLVQVKVESAPPGQLISALGDAPPHLQSVVGHAGVQLIDALRRGASGVQPGCSFAEIYLRIWNAWDAGDEQGAVTLHSRLLPYIAYWMQGVELIISAEKRISMRRGLITSDHCREPARKLDRGECEMIDRFLEEFADFF